ncbi:21497_t:CDS:1 [Cetraspora pellucida]|uniref:21497_t:CDS:1 n=1 Tax=Cetraspora pellucida TaxID=1433469 RepID=A0A9N8WM34_9GLOM|nr:21497_t:CDS:1 [Cetraspora pellucida]
MPTNPTSCIETLNKQWYKLSIAMKKAANETTKVTPHTYLAFTKKSILLYTALKNLNKSLHILISTKPPTLLQQIIIQINHLLKKTQTLTDLPIEILSENSLTYTNFSNTVN